MDYLIVVLLSVAVVALVAWPLLARRPGPAGGAADSEDASRTRAEVEEALTASLSAIREIEFDHRAGNLSEEDFVELDRTERARAAELIRRRDGLDDGPSGDPKAVSP